MPLCCSLFCAGGTETVNKSWVGKLVSSLGTIASYTEPVLFFSQAASQVGESVAKIHKNAVAEKKFSEMTGAFGVLRGVCSGGRVVFEGWKWVTLTAIYKQEADGSWKVKEDGSYELQSPFVIAMNVCGLAARTVTVGCAVHFLKIKDLGAHADRMGYACVGLWTFVLTLDTIDATVELCNNEGDWVKNLTNWGGRVCGWFSYVLFDMPAITNKHPAFGIISGCFILGTIIYNVICDINNS